MTMNNAFKELFSPIQAGEELKDSTKAFLAEKTQNYRRAAPERRRYHIYAAACACLLFVLLGGQRLYFTPTAEISIDINPSIELSVNRFDQVISVSEFNEDGQALSKSVDIKYKNYVEAIERILHHDSILNECPRKYFRVLRPVRRAGTTPIAISRGRKMLLPPMMWGFPAENTEPF